MDTRISQILALGKRGAERRFRELLIELKVLIGGFPELSDAFDPDELPLSFIIKRDSGRAQTRLVRRQRAVATPSKADGRRRAR